MERYGYGDIPSAIKEKTGIDVSVRTIRFWVKERIIPGPKGSNKYRYFDFEDVLEIMGVARLRNRLNRSIEDIKNIKAILALDYVFELPEYGLVQFLQAMENTLKARGCLHDRDEANKEIDAFLNRERSIVEDRSYVPPFVLVDEQWESSRYIEERGLVIRCLDFITDDKGSTRYYKPDEIERYLVWEEEILKEGLPDRECALKDHRQEADKIRALINEGIGSSPLYRFKEEAYLSQGQIMEAKTLLYFLEDYGFGYDDLRRLRRKIEADIDRYFYTPEENKTTRSRLYYEFEKHTTFFDMCLSALHNELFFREDAVVGHTRADSVRIIKDYLEGFLFLCWSVFGGIEGPILIKNTPIEQFSLAQMKKALLQGRISEADVVKVAKAREEELEGIRTLTQKLIKGGT